MKLKNFLILLLILTATSANAQFGITKENYMVSVMDFPQYYIKPEDRTYCVTIENKSNNLVTDNIITDEIYIPGWKELSGDSAFLVINFRILPLAEQGTDFKDVVSEKTTRDGIELIHHYTPTIKYVFNVRAQFKNRIEQYEVNSTPLGEASVKKYTIRQEFSTKDEAYKYIKENKNLIYSNIVSETFNNMFNEIREKLCEKFLPYNSTEVITISYLLDEGNPFEDYMKQAQQYLPQELGMIEGESPMDNAKPGINVWLEKFKYIAGEIDGESPAEKKAKEEMIRNLASLYFIMEDYDQCTMYSQILKETYKNKEADKFLRSIKTIQAQMAKHKQKSRHFSIR